MIMNDIPPRHGEGDHAQHGGGAGTESGAAPPPRAARAVPLPVPGRRESGFSLVELMVVIVIIGLLATVVIINVMPAADRAATTKVRADIATLEQAIDIYKLDHLTYPPPAEGLQALVTGRYIRRLPNDPWGNPYRYTVPGRDGRPFQIASWGADGREGGSGNDADITN